MNYQKNSMKEDTASKWQAKKLFFSLLGIALLFLTWLLYFTHPFWEAADAAFYHFVNGFIKKSTYWQNFWAISNHSITDWFHDLVMLFFFVAYIARKSEKSYAKKIVELVFFAAVVTFTVLFINRFLCLDVLEIKRKSPTMIYELSTHLSQKVTWLKIKDKSVVTFPGDHGTTALLFTLFTFHLMGKRAGILALLYNFYWQLPRLVTGCHWLTDIIMGSFVISTFMTSICIYTPLKESVTDLLSRPFDRKRKEESLDLKSS